MIYFLYIFFFSIINSLGYELHSGVCYETKPKYIIRIN